MTNVPKTERPDDALVRIGVTLTPAQFREINARADLRPFDGRARSEFMLGCALDEPRGELLARVQKIAGTDRVKARAGIAAERAQREAA